MSQAALATGFAARLVAVQTSGSYHALLGGRIYEERGPENETFPYGIWSIITDVPFRYFGHDDIEVEIQVDTYSDARNTTAASMRTIIDALDTALDGQSVTITGFSGGVVECLDRGPIRVDGNVYSHTSRWRVTASAN